MGKLKQFIGRGDWYPSSEQLPPKPPNGICKMNRGLEIPLDFLCKNPKYSCGSMYTTDIFFLLSKYYPELQNKIFECLELADKNTELIVNDYDRYPNKPTFEYKY